MLRDEWTKLFGDKSMYVAGYSRNFPFELSGFTFHSLGNSTGRTRLTNNPSRLIFTVLLSSSSNLFVGFENNLILIFQSIIIINIIVEINQSSIRL